MNAKTDHIHEAAAKLAEGTEVQYALVANHANKTHVFLGLYIRHAKATVVIRIPKERYDAIALWELTAKFGAEAKLP